MAKKSFKGNLKDALTSPATAFISSAEVAPKAVKTEESIPVQAELAGIIPEGMRLVAEAKSRRVHLLMRPTSYGWIETKAAAAGVSVNEMINRVIEDAKKAEGK